MSAERSIKLPPFGSKPKPIAIQTILPSPSPVRVPAPLKQGGPKPRFASVELVQVEV